MAIKKCRECLEEIEELDEIISIDNEYYHTDCVKLYPTGYIALTHEGDMVGEVDDDSDGQLACLVLDEGEYLEEDDDDVDGLD